MRTADGERGAVLVPTLIAAVVGAVLAVGASVVIVQSVSDSGAAPVTRPLVSYDER